MLDEHTLKTPARLPLLAPTKALALAIAAEWEWQIRLIEPSTMPLMSLASTAIDQPQSREVVVNTMVQYVSTDPVVCRIESGELAERQAAALDPVVAWVHEEMGAKLEPTDSIFGLQLRPKDEHLIKNYINSKR